MIALNTIQEVNPAQAYFEGMLWTAFGVRIFSDNVAEWRIYTRTGWQRALKLPKANDRLFALAS